MNQKVELNHAICGGCGEEFSWPKQRRGRHRLYCSAACGRVARARGALDDSLRIARSEESLALLEELRELQVVVLVADGSWEVADDWREGLFEEEFAA